MGMDGTSDQRTSSHRKPRSDGERTRAAILQTAAELATVEGLAGLSIGCLAIATGLSKSGLYAHFGSKQELQLATVERAEQILTTDVLRPALAAPPGLPQLLAACEAFFDYLQHAFPGGCFFAATAMEMGTRPGPVRDRIAAIQTAFTAQLRAFAVTAIEQHELSAQEDPDRLAFELHALLLGADTKFVLHDDPTVLDLARAAIRHRLGLPSEADPPPLAD
jgi:AcrR family transcriptional regulator